MRKKFLIYGVLPAVILILSALFLLYRIVFGPEIHGEKPGRIIIIPTGATYNQVMDSITSEVKINYPVVFGWIARQKNYPSLIKPGRYVIDRDISYNALLNILRSGRQSPVQVTFSNIRTLNQLAGRIGKQLEADSASIMDYLSDEANYSADGFSRETIISVFIPNTYEIYRNTDAKGFYNRMLREFRSFWNEGRISRAKAKGLTPIQVSILASIIDDEVVKPDEKPRIAGVYLNRLKMGIPLQACPTIKFALNDFTITRVLTKYLETESPYNTYKHTGFPPGPIGCPSIEGLEAVLNAEDHDFLFFVARADFSGYHHFSRTLPEHNHYASLYQKELDRRRIFK